MAEKKVSLPVGIFLVIVGLFLVINAGTDITGAAIGGAIGPAKGTFIGFIILFIGAFLLALGGLEKRITLTSAIKKYDAIRRLAEEAAGNERVKIELDHLAHELSRGNLKAGLGRPGYLPGTSIFYLRGRNGGRLYYHETNAGYEIVGKSAKGNNQEKVINKLVKLYSR